MNKNKALSPIERFLSLSDAEKDAELRHLKRELIPRNGVR
jgi:hypothetical protein